MLSVEITPGKQFVSGEKVDLDKLNALGSPTAALDGEIDATQVVADAYFYGEDEGADSALTATVTPSFAALKEGMKVRVKVANTNTSTSGCTLNVNGTGQLPLVRAPRTALEPKQIFADQVIEVVYVVHSVLGGAWMLVSPAAFVGETQVRPGRYWYILAQATADPAQFVLVTNALAYDTGQFMWVQFGTGCPGSVEVAYSIDGTVQAYKAVKKYAAGASGGKVAVGPGDWSAGAVILLVYDGTDFVVVSQLSTVQIVTPRMERLRIGNDTIAPDNKVAITADYVIALDAAGFGTKWTGLAVTADLTVSGAGGLDTGSEASDTWYYVWIILQPGGSPAQASALLSLSSTAPTLPDGWTHKILAGAVRNDGSGNLVRFLQRDRRISAAAQQVFTGKAAAAANTYETLAGADLTAYQAAVPPIANIARLQAGVTNYQVSDFSAAATSDGVAAERIAAEPNGAALSGIYNMLPVQVMLYQQNIWWKAGITAATWQMSVTGWEW